MHKRLGLRLSAYLVTPHKLRASPSRAAAATTVDVDVAALFHHHYLDSRGHRPPDPDPARFEHLNLFLPGLDLRARGGGLGSHGAFRTNKANELGQAFCRLFLSRYLNIHYFMHMEHALSGPLIPAFGGYRLERTDRGDTPDYFCAESCDRIFLAEAKGTRDSVSFKNARFAKWREQFKRVTLYDARGVARRVKGHIVATRFAAETDSAVVRSTIYAEDPETAGELPFEGADGLGAAVIRSHYAGIADKLDQPILSSALGQGFVVPEEIRFPAVVWEIRVGPLAGTRFVGGFFSSDDDRPRLVEEDGGLVVERNPLRLDRPGATFFGLEEGLFSILSRIVHDAPQAIREVTPLRDIPFFYSGVSILPDGTAIGPLEFFRAVGQKPY